VKACQAVVDFQSYALVLLTCAVVFLTAAVVCLTWLSPNVDRSWLPRGLRKAPSFGGDR
jgi:hypothetical protein